MIVKGCFPEGDNADYREAPTFVELAITCRTGCSWPLPIHSSPPSGDRPTIMVPLFCKRWEVIKIDTRDHLQSTRVK